MVTKSFINALIIIGMIFSGLLQAEMEERRNTGNLLEPIDRVLHGAGQAGITGFDGFENYWNCAPDGLKPMLFMDYFDTYHIKEKWSKELKEELLKYHRKGFYVIPQLGLNINYFYKDIIEGKHEKELENLVKGFEYLGMPVYFRIGYEFNNQKPWSPEDYVKAFQIITEKLRDAKLEVATVWNCGLSGGMPGDNIYPGDEHVDWMGYNTFSDISNGQHAVALKILEMAGAHNKPVMIGEASPSSVNDPNLSKNWNWYGIYFKMIGDQPLIKQMTYINWDWDVQDMVGGNIGFPWGDVRLEIPGAVKDKYFDQMKDAKYFHASSEKEFRNILGYDDNEAPEPVINLRREGDFLVWEGAQDRGESEFAHYTIYKNDKFWDYLINRKYPIHDLGLGKDMKVYVTAVDRAGNEGEKSNVVNADKVSSIELIIDGEFDEPITSLGLDWTFRGTNDGGALIPDDFTHDTTSKLSGKYSALLKWTKKPQNAKDWKLQFLQAVNVEQGKEYHITFKAVASADVEPKLYFMSHHINPQATHFPAGTDYKFEDEWHKYNIWTFKIGTSPQEYSFTGTPDKTELGRLSFMFGHLDPVDVWLDDISVIVGDPVDIHNQAYTHNPEALHFKISDHLLNGNKTLSYTLPKKGTVTIGVYDLRGKMINQIVNQVQTRGNHSLQWNTNKLSSGMYILKVSACKATAVDQCFIAR